jgi:hypothetical protein
VMHTTALSTISTFGDHTPVTHLTVVSLFSLRYSPQGTSRRLVTAHTAYATLYGCTAVLLAR